MKLSKRTFAREWLIFLSTLPFGGALCFWHDFYSNPILWNWAAQSHRPHFFWYEFRLNDFGLFHWEMASVWLIPFAAVSLIRSILWAIAVIRISN